VYYLSGGGFVNSTVLKLILIALIITMGMACGQRGELGLEGQQVNIANTGDDAEIRQQIKNCQNLASSNQLISFHQDIRFEDTKTESGRNEVCEFATGDQQEYKGNLSILNSFLRARYTQTKSLDVPANAVICDVGIESAEQSFKYDDIFFLSLNNQILASNHKSEIEKVIQPESFLHTQSNAQIDVYQYDWLKIRGTSFENVVNDYCLGAQQSLSQCEWPITEQFGKIKLKFDPEILIRLSQKRIDNQHQLSFVITGDNDLKLDCYHQRLDLKLNVKYYLK
jgi:hypothetical protein